MARRARSATAYRQALASPTCPHLHSKVADPVHGYRVCLDCGTLGFRRGSSMVLQKRMIPYKCTHAGCRDDAKGRAKGRTSSGSLRFTCALHTPRLDAPVSGHNQVA